MHRNDSILDCLIVWNLTKSFEFGVDVARVFERTSRESHDTGWAANCGDIQIVPLRRQVLLKKSNDVHCALLSCAAQKSVVIECKLGLSIV